MNPLTKPVAATENDIRVDRLIREPSKADPTTWVYLVVVLFRLISWLFFREDRIPVDPVTANAVKELMRRNPNRRLKVVRSVKQPSGLYKLYFETYPTYGEFPTDAVTDAETTFSGAASLETALEVPSDLGKQLAELLAAETVNVTPTPSEN